MEGGCKKRHDDEGKSGHESFRRASSEKLSGVC